MGSADSVKVIDLLCEIKKTVLENNADNKLPGNSFYLSDGSILCCQRDDGNSRYPYNMDGMNLWLNSNGYIEADEGAIKLFRKVDSMEEATVDFWGGIKTENGKWFPISIGGATRQLFEPENINRYTVFMKRCAYYICETDNVVFWLKSCVTSKKQISITLGAINKTESKISLYLASFMEFMLMGVNYEGVYGRMNKYGKLYDNGTFKISKNDDMLRMAIVNTLIDCPNDAIVEGTVGKSNFIGRTRASIASALSLKEGKYKRNVTSANTSEWPVVSNIVKFDLDSNDDAKISYLINFTSDENVADALLNNKVNLKEINDDIVKQENDENTRMSSLDIKFGKMNGVNLNNNVFNEFIKNIQKQTDLCAFGKNYVGSMLGVRDVYQQIETALIWDPDTSKKKIIYAIGHTMDTGRSPRQFSVPQVEGEKVKLDMREFIDQGLWVINAIYKYLSYTNDYSILDVVCPYYTITDYESVTVEKSDISDTLLEHIVKIVDYLILNIDNETNCLKILYGDWNDAVNGLGKTKEDKEFGNGVSVMASLQLYQVLYQIADILNHAGKFQDKAKNYLMQREILAQGLEKYAVQNSGDMMHIVHGWGDKRSYFVGSVKDRDGKCRYSATSNSFWSISDMLKRDVSLKNTIMNTYNVLDSKYGIKTFEPYFPENMEEEVGRIVKLTPGTLENSCTYIHSTTFAIIALFKMCESKMAWEQIEKIVPITHDNLTLSTFVMPNSYFYNEEYQMDGESMVDWYTGSGAVFLRGIIENAIGIQPNLDGLNISLSEYLPSDSLDVSLKIKGHNATIIYNNENHGIRKYCVNSKEYEVKKDELGVSYISIPNNEISDNMIIRITD